MLEKKWLLAINRIQPPPEHQRGLRLHRAERLSYFPEEFFSKFINSIKQEDIMYYPDTSLLINKLSEKFNISEDNILIYPGSTITIKDFFEVFSSPNKKVLVTQYCFPFHWIFPKTQNTKIQYINNIFCVITFVNKATFSSTSLVGIIISCPVSTICHD